MGYEPAIPPIPTRSQEVRYIEKLAQSYRDQNYLRWYSPEYLRVNKMEHGDKLRRINLDWYSNFGIGKLVFTRRHYVRIGLHPTVEILH